MAVNTMEAFDKSLRFAYSDPKTEVAMGRSMFDPDPIPDADWWEPRYDIPYRREDARYREWFGGERFGQAAAPNLGPNNPIRLQAELEQAEQNLSYADERAEAANEEINDELARIQRLRAKLPSD